jgi:hypothetical protein
MTRTLLISSFLCSAMMIGCGDDGKGAATTNTTKTTPAADDGGDDTTGNVNPSASSDPSATDPSNPTTQGDETADPSAATTNASSATEPATTAGDEGTTGCGFICDTTGGNTTVALCDVFKQDCPEGEKCSAYAEGGGSSWNATKCVPVTGEGTPGDACTTEGGGVSGLDDCQKGAMCWDVDAENKGLCVELCGGTEASPTCSNEADFGCAVVNDGVLNLCLPDCDPLIQNCPGDDLCIPIADTFVCVLDASGADAGKAFDPCEFANSCDKGLGCFNPANAMECDANAGGCCLPFCDLSDPGVKCPGVGQSCVSLYEEGMAPPEFENVGVCAIPG